MAAFCRLVPDRAALRKQRVHDLVDFAPNVVGLVGRWDRLRQFCLAKRGERCLVFEEIDAADVTGRLIAPVDLLDQARHLAKTRASRQKPTLEFFRLEGGPHAHEQDR